MNTVITISAIWILITVILNLLIKPFMIGKEREPVTPADYVTDLLVVMIPVALLCGRALTWW